jgi:hypothetical protein
MKSEFIFRILAVFVTFLSSASCEKTIECTFKDHQWFYFDKPLKTCFVGEQVIDEVGFIIDSPQDQEVKGFDIQLNEKVEYLLENFSEKFPNLLELSVWRCSIKSVGEHHFKGLHELVELNLAYNKIETVDSKAFGDNLKLEWIRLAHNQIKHLNNDLFSMLPDLKHLELNHNQLEAVDGSLLKNNSKLKFLWFHNNKLKSIDPEIVDDKPILRQVDFEMNTCINKAYAAVSFKAMKEKIVQDCSPNTNAAL